MLAEKVAIAENELIDKLWQNIQTRTWRRIRDLEIESQNGRLTIRGCAPTYYVKQLALRAICDVAGTENLAIHIDVADAMPPLHLYEVLAG